MDIRKFADMLNNRQYGEEITKKEEALAKELGFVVVFGYSDDCVELRGAIYDEDSVYGGGTLNIDECELLEDCDCDCKHYKKALENSSKIKVIFGGECTWNYETEIPHQEFNIFEDDDLYCKGIVFDINNLK